MEIDRSLTPLNAVLQTLRRLPNARARTRALQLAMGPRTDDPGLLHRRALLVTALRESGIWAPPYQPLD